MKYYVYILQSLKDKKFYTGITNDPIRRQIEHNVGKSSTPSTRNRGPFRIVHLEECSCQKEARKREIYWKSGVGRELRNKITKKMVAVAQW